MITMRACDSRADFIYRIQFENREFKTTDGKAHFTVHPLPEIELQQDQFLMMTMRSHDQFNTTIYGLDDRYRGIHNGRRVVFLNPEDIRAVAAEEGQVVDLVSHFDGEERIARRFQGRAVQYSAPLRRHLFSGSERAGAGATFRGQEPHAGVEVGGDQHPTRRKVSPQRAQRRTENDMTR